MHLVNLHIWFTDRKFFCALTLSPSESVIDVAWKLGHIKLY